MEINWKLLTAQDALIFSDAPEFMLSGAFGSGKTLGLCRKIFLDLWNFPGNRVGLFRANLSALRATTLRSLLYGDGQEPAVIPAAAIRDHNKNEHIVTLINGSELIYGGMQSATLDRTWFNSLNLGNIGVDQAEELPLEDWLMLQGRLRLNVPAVRQIYGACNPRNQSHWIYQRFFIDRANGCKAVTSKTSDNPHLPDDYIARMNTFTGPFYDRFVLGKWVGLEGLVYENFDPTRLLVDNFELKSSWRRWRAIDFGYTNPFVCLWACEVGADNAGGLPEGSVVIYREIYHSRKRTAEHAEMIRNYSDGYTFQATYADHDAGERAELHARGVPTINARKNVSLGIQRVRQWIDDDRIYFFRNRLLTNDIALTIDPVSGKKVHAPKNTADEFGFYRWQTDRGGGVTKEEPVKTHDHGMDTIRYLIMGIEGSANQITTTQTIRGYA